MDRVWVCIDNDSCKSTLYGMPLYVGGWFDFLYQKIFKLSLFGLLRERYAK